VMNGTRLAALGGVALMGALALTACGTDDNGGGGGGGTTASGDCVKSTVNAAGSSAQANAMSEWIKGYQQNCPGSNVNYNPSGSGAGVQAFTGGQVAFAGSDSALKPEEHGPADARCKTGKAIDLPMVGGPIAIMYNLKGVDGLQLSPTTIAGIFAGKIKTWNDAGIKKDNPSATLPATPIKPLHRSDDSGTTDNLTKFLLATAPDVWKFEGGKTFPKDAGGQGLKGSDGVSTGIKQGEGTIGYAELSYATNGKIQTAKVANGSGAFSEISSDAASKAIAGATVAGTGNDLALKIDYKAKDGYPIVLVTYEIVCSKYADAGKGTAVKAFLTSFASDQTQSGLEELGYAPLPKEVQSKVQAAVGAVS
jgi:phosphate transport system substrate-binding protein